MTEGRGRNRRASVRITGSSMIQWEEHRPAYARTTNSPVGGCATRHKPMSCTHKNLHVDMLACVAHAITD